MEKQELLEVRNIVEDIKNNGLNDKYMVKLYDYLGNPGIPLITSNTFHNTASFSPKFMSISVNTSNCLDWSKKILDESLDYFSVEDKELLQSYLIITLLAHEVEHSSQKLIADGKKEPNYEFKKDVYHDIYEVLRAKKYALPRPISLGRDIIRYFIYEKNEYDFILERNATIEGYNTASLVAEAANEKELLSYLISVRNSIMLQGYIDKKIGTLKYTYKKLGMMNKYRNLNIPNDIPLNEKIREGLELREEERTNALVLLKKNINLKENN